MSLPQGSDGPSHNAQHPVDAAVHNIESGLKGGLDYNSVYKEINSLRQSDTVNGNLDSAQLKTQVQQMDQKLHDDGYLPNLHIALDDKNNAHLVADQPADGQAGKPGDDTSAKPSPRPGADAAPKPPAAAADADRPPAAADSSQRPAERAPTPQAHGHGHGRGHGHGHGRGRHHGRHHRHHQHAGSGSGQADAQDDGDDDQSTPTSGAGDATGKPVDAAGKPGDATAKPGDVAGKPGDATLKPGDAAAKPGDATVKPGDAATKPGDLTAKPADAGAKPSDNPVTVPVPKVADSQLTVSGAPTITPEKIDEVLKSYHSPAQGMGKDIYDQGVKHGINPAMALAFYVQESSAGTRGQAVHNNSWGNERGHGANGYRPFDNIQNSMHHWYDMMSNKFSGSLGHVIPHYAPGSDGNNEGQYIHNVASLVRRWQS